MTTAPTTHRGRALTILSSIAILNALGVLFVFQASVPESLMMYGEPYAMFQQHVLGVGLGWLALIIGYCIPSGFWQKTAPLLLIIGLLTLVLVFIPGIGLELNGARRWISLSGLRLQPVEFFKFAFITYLALWMSSARSLVSFALLMSIPIVLLLLQPDLGSLLLLLAIAGGLYFVNGGSWKSMAALVGGLAIVVSGAVLLAPYRLRRLTTFLDPESDPLGASFHIRQIILALGRGGVTGQGIGNSNQKFAYIPELSTDSIFAIVGEELGFVGSVLIVGLFVFLFYTMYRYIQIAITTPFAQRLGFGILLWISAQAMLNLSAVVALIPLTGIPLPLFSYGRSSLVMVLFAMGVFIRLGNTRLWQR